MSGWIVTDEPIIERVLKARDGTNRGGSRKFTSDEAIDLLGRLLAGERPAEIAKVMGRPKRSVTDWIYRNRLLIERKRLAVRRAAEAAKRAPEPADDDDRPIRRPTMAQLMSGR